MNKAVKILPIILLSIFTVGAQAFEEDNIISPFSTFKWGDNFNTVMTKLCDMDVTSIAINFNESKKKVNVCQPNPYDLNDYLIADVDDFPSRFKNDFMIHMKTKFDDKNIFYSQNLFIAADSIYIKDVEYTLALGFKESDEQTIRGAVINQSTSPTKYLFKGVEYTVPLFLNSVTLYPVNKEVAMANRDVLYNLLQAKYNNYKGLNQRLAKHKIISVSNKGTSIRFDGASINYDGTKLMREVHINAYKSHVIPKDTLTHNDSSSGL
jgi:hypothetical protein